MTLMPNQQNELQLWKPLFNCEDSSEHGRGGHTENRAEFTVAFCYVQASMFVHVETKT